MLEPLLTEATTQGRMTTLAWPVVVEIDQCFCGM